MRYGHEWTDAKINAYTTVLSNALAILKEGGEIRADGWFPFQVSDLIKDFAKTNNVTLSIALEKMRIKKSDSTP